MSSDVIIGHDGKPRCVWAGVGDTAGGRYHDEVWGTRAYDEPALFEALTLGVFEVALSWAIVFGKRDAFRKAFPSTTFWVMESIRLDLGYGSHSFASSGNGGCS